MSKYADEIDNGGVVKYYRVQGGTGTNQTSQELLTLEPNGNLTFNSTLNDLNLSTDTREHADYFIQCCRPGGYIIEFEVPKSLDIDIKTSAIPEFGSTSNLFNSDGLLPKIGDPNKPGDPFELTSLYHNLLSLEYIKGSAKILP